MTAPLSDQEIAELLAGADPQFRLGHAAARKEAADWIANAEKRIANDERTIAALQDEIATLRRQRDEARKCVAFFSSVIKSGESWTACCEDAARAALGKDAADV